VAMANPIPLEEAETRAVLSVSFSSIDQTAVRRATPNETELSHCCLRRALLSRHPSQIILQL
jgi:hypothetical protein